jgi:excinuclease ABC subunit B
MYADSISDAMNYAIKETNRRRAMQLNFNLENNVEPVTIKKDIRENISIREEIIEEEKDYQKLTRKDRDKIVKDLENEMKQAAKNLDFERAAELRDLIFELKADE